MSATLLWAFGAGPVGQSYLYTRDGRWYEARASYFGSLEGLNFTPGRALMAPPSLEEAMARSVNVDEVVGCFRCHASGVTSEHTVGTASLQLGVTCEACHGPGREHVLAANVEVLETGAPRGGSDGRVFNPSHLSPTDSVEFCGACHSTWWDIRMTGKMGKATVAFPVYRLHNSKCWGKQGDTRLTCTACHDPHTPLERNLATYDTRCLACHAVQAGQQRSAERPGRACPVAKADCASCHMPEVDVPELHHMVRDHDIRIVRPNEIFPE